MGAKRDGLVHVKDISKDYFIQNHEQKFIAGQDIDVWVKFIEPKSERLGLQMFPQVARAGRAPVSPSSVSLDDFEEEDEVSGTVVRVSNYGVFVDIGAGVDAFLPRRKMKMTKRMRSYKPWEIAPLGSKVDGIIHELDQDRKRISLTTYAVEDWDEMLPMKREDGADGSMMVEDEEELGGSAMADNLRALERTLSLSMGDDEDEEGEDGEGLGDDDDDDEGEELSAEEIRALTMGRASTPQIVIDDFGGSGGSGGRRAKAGPSPEEVVAERRGAGSTTMEDQGEEISVEELFQELCGKGRDYVTVRDVMKWDYLQDLIADGDVTQEEVAELFDEAGASNGKLQEVRVCARLPSPLESFPPCVSLPFLLAFVCTQDEFDAFVDLLADALGLEEEGGAYDMSMGDPGDDEDEQDGEEDSGEADAGAGAAPAVLMDDFSDAAAAGEQAASISKKKTTGRGGQNRSDGPVSAAAADDEELDFGLGFGGTVLGTGPFDLADADADLPPDADDALSLADHYEKRSKTNELFQYVFSAVAGKKGHVVWDDALRWDFVQALLAQGATTEAEVKAAFSKAKPRQGKLGYKEFETFVGIVSDVATLQPDAAPAPAQGVVDLTPRDGRTDVILSPPTRAATAAATNDDDEDIDDEEAAAVAAAFKALSGGKPTVSLAAVAEWDLVAELMQEGMLTREDLEEFFAQAGGRRVAAGKGKGKGKAAAAAGGALDLKGFEALLDLLAPLAGDADDDADAADDDDDFDGVALGDGDDDEEKVTRTAVVTADGSTAPADDEGATDAEEDDEDYADEEEGELLSSVFANLANGKAYVTAKDMQNWDIVLELMGEGLLTDDVLREKIAECPGFTGKGVPLEGFDKLVDKLVELYGELDEYSPEDNTAVIDATGMNLTGDGDEDDEDEGFDDEEDDEGDEEDEYVDIDTEEEFEAVAKGKDFVTFDDLKVGVSIRLERAAHPASPRSLPGTPTPLSRTGSSSEA